MRNFAFTIRFYFCNIYLLFYSLFPKYLVLQLSGKVEVKEKRNAIRCIISILDSEQEGLRDLEIEFEFCEIFKIYSPDIILFSFV